MSSVTSTRTKKAIAKKAYRKHLINSHGKALICIYEHGIAKQMLVLNLILFFCSLLRSDGENSLVGYFSNVIHCPRRYVHRGVGNAAVLIYKAARTASAPETDTPELIEHIIEKEKRFSCIVNEQNAEEKKGNCRLVFCAMGIIFWFVFSLILTQSRHRRR